MQRFYVFTLTLFSLFGLLFVCGCDQMPDAMLAEVTSAEPPVETEQPPLRVTMIYPSDCVGSAAYCDGFHVGLQTTVANFGIDLNEAANLEASAGGSGINESFYVDPRRSDSKFGISFRQVTAAADDPVTSEQIVRDAAANSDLVLAAGYQATEPIAVVASDFPDVKFVVFDAVLDLPNVASINYKASEGSFLVGAIAALKSETGQIGYIGGVDIPLLQEFEAGYIAGVHAINPEAEVSVAYVSADHPSGFTQPEKAKQLALAQYERGVDVIYTAAGGSGQGVLDAAIIAEKYIIWVDSNGNHLAPGLVLTSMIKEIPASVEQVVRETVAGDFMPGIRYLGLEEGGVNYTLDEYNAPLLSAEMVTTVESLKAGVISGDIVVPTTVSLPR